MTMPPLLVTLAGLALRLASLVVIAQPGYTDAYYYATTAARLAHGEGLTADFLWAPLDAPTLAPFPIPSHRFWMPLATVVQAAGIVVLGPLLGDFRAGQLALVLASLALPPVSYALARTLGASDRAAIVAALLVALGGLFAPAWPSLDGFGLAALLGSLFFLAFDRAARGDVRAAALCGLCAGLLYLARAEGALFGVPLLALVGRRGARRAGLAGSAIALAIGLAWLARGALLGASPDLLARGILLPRYDAFFSLTSPTGSVDLWARLGALLTNASTALVALFVLLAPGTVLGARALWSRADVRAFVWLALGVYLAESLLFTLHSTRGSYFHSLAAFFPFAVALAVVGTERLLAARLRRVAFAGALALAAVMSVGALLAWDESFNVPYRARAAALGSIPSGPFSAIDAAAWRWISGRSVVVTPSDGLASARCLATRYGARTLVLEPVHFAAYEALYQGSGIIALPLEPGPCP
ncbi:MAG: hypothetical protein HY071_00925 [Chloroflexi bacterium]|nr:hypothetical protein [Chloroflexota bacterium]